MILKKAVKGSNACIVNLFKILPFRQRYFSLRYDDLSQQTFTMHTWTRFRGMQRDLTTPVVLKLFCTL